MENSSRRWSGYVCPDCRFVFRVPRDHDGEGVVCPSCRRLLKIPGVDDTPPALVAPPPPEELAQEPPKVESTPGMAEKRRKRSRSKPRTDEEPSWEKEARRRVRSVTGRNAKAIWALVGGGVIFAGTIGFLLTVFSNRNEAPLVVAPLPSKPVETEVEEDPVELPDVMKRSEAAFLAEAQPMARKFLEATTVEELLPLVRNPKEAEPRMRRFYPGGKVDAPGVSAFNSTGGTSYRGKFASILVRTKDYEMRQLAFTETEEGLKIDWESYVGWSEMSWEDFMAAKPTKPQVFRVWLRRMEYYNFAFEDDVEWQSYQILSPDRQHLLYGYVKRESPVDGQVRPDEKKKEVAMMLALKYRPGETKENQVVIERYLNDGWVEGIDDK